MKYNIILLLAVGLSGIVAKSVLKHVSDKELLLSESNDSGTNHKEEPSNNDETEQNNESAESLEIVQPKFKEIVDIVIEENNETPNTEAPFDLQEPSLFNSQDNNDISLEDEYVPVQEGDYFFNDVINKDPNEIMDTASGFVPIPIFRRQQKPRRQRPIVQASRRYYRRPTYNPYRRFYFYPYYQFYRPSSLRFY